MKKQIEIPVLPVQFPVIKSGITSASKLQQIFVNLIHELVGEADGQIPATTTLMGDSFYISSEIGGVNLCIGITNRMKP